MSFETLFEDHAYWSANTFPNATARGALLHAEREVKEVIQDFDNGATKGDKATEIMDAIFCLMDAAGRAGIDFNDLKLAGFEKLKKNKARKWKDNGDGSYSHIKDGE